VRARDSLRAARHNRAVVRKHFTPVQANRTLPLVRRIVDDILERGRELRSLAKRQHIAEIQGRIGQLEVQIRDLVVELESIGCEYKDFSFDKGLVDFPGQIEGRDVLLCWKSDEPRVEWFHPYDAGFSGRARIPEHLLSASAT
jgi:hypothetical protein